MAGIDATALVRTPPTVRDARTFQTWIV